MTIPRRTRITASSTTPAAIDIHRTTTSRRQSTQPFRHATATAGLIDLITRDENIRWLFSTDIDNTQGGTLAAVLAESMTIPDVEREALQRRSHAVIGASSKGEITGTTPTKPTGSEATTGIAE
ncbi:hypothetical protein ACPPVO_23070 [Dactylosporangium sp. McL0621]|uniref:hypothetical protein n=1 Tax=Dactylosporangium sp. McL0621 TaxID=3415678 RepID=UPI003CE8A48D